MGSLGEIMQLCRLCLVKDKVNIPIFEGAGDIRKISHKISACLPVKVAKDDKLPKKICDGCSLKLDVIYQFWNTSTASEKQLLEWVNNPSSLKGESQDSRTNVAEHIVLKQEIDNGDSEALDAGEFIDVNDSFENIGYTHDDDDDMSNENIAIKTENDSQSYIEPPRKKQKVVSLSSAESEEDADDPSDAYNRDDSDEEDNDISDAQPTFVNVSDADQQPGPSGVGKSSGDAPFLKFEFLQPKIEVEEIIETKEVKKDKPWVCPVCKKIFKLNKTYRSHKFHYRDKPDHKECIECSRVFKNQTDLITHIDYIHKKVRLSCEICWKDFPDPFSLRSHKKTHNPDYQKPEFRCDICAKIFVSNNTLRIHKDGIHNLKKFICEVCGKELSTSNGLRLHTFTHTGERKYVCEVCGKKFSTKGRLVEHSVVHTKVKKHKCKLCERSYTQRSAMNTHVKIKHKKEEKYECVICSRKFSTASLMNHHLKSHNKTAV